MWPCTQCMQVKQFETGIITVYIHIEIADKGGEIVISQLNGLLNCCLSLL
jgi:hypothetical protein